MTTWLYYSAIGAPARITDFGWKQLQLPKETVGARELELLLQARGSSFRHLVLPHGREHNAQRMAARRLVERGLLQEPNAVGGGYGTYRLTRGRRQWLYVYNLTERGWSCWLRSKQEQSKGAGA